MPNFEFYQRFRDSYPSFDVYVEEVKKYLLDDTQFSNDELKLSYYLMVGNYWMSPIGFYDDDLFKLNHAQKVSIHLPRLLSQMETMDAIVSTTNFNLTNEVKKVIEKVRAQEVESTQLSKRNDTPNLGDNVDLLSDTFLSQSERLSGDGSTSENEDVEETTTATDTPFKQLMAKLSAVDYSFINTYIEKFKRDFLTIKLGGEFYQ